MKRTVKRGLVRNHAVLAPFIPDKHLPYHFAGGRIYLNVKESPMMLARALGLYERGKAKVIGTFLKPGATFIDVGVNRGYFSLLAARIVGDDGQVLSFEPEPNNCHWIRKSIQLNRYKNIRLYELALSDTNGDAQLHLAKKSGWHTLLPKRREHSEGVISVVTRTLDSILGQINQNKVNVMKIDVEGAELEVLRGAYKTLSNNRDIVVLMDIHPGLGVDPKEASGFLIELGFSIFQMRSPFDVPVQIDKELKELLAYR
jgi:FkbM family methyltransferase